MDFAPAALRADLAELGQQPEHPLSVGGAVRLANSVTKHTVEIPVSPVTPSYGLLHLLPRDLPGPNVPGHGRPHPEPDDDRERTDFFGNRVAYFAIPSPHRRLTVTAESTVVVGDRQGTVGLSATRPWETVRDHPAVALGPELDARYYVLDSALVATSAQLADDARPSFSPGRRFLDAVADLTARIHADFDYEPGSTSVSTPLAEVFEQRTGVCQDFAHLGIGCLRSLGLAARYVSGNLETQPPPGRRTLAGADVSHAWVSVFVPGSGRVDVDPTNNQFVNDRYVTTAWGRDHSDVPPLTGVIYTEGKTNKLKVAVDVVPVSE